MDRSTAEQIAQGLSSGDTDAWRALYDALAQPVWRFVARISAADGPTVADIVQETFLAAARSARGFDPVRGSLEGWLFGIARNKTLAHLRRSRTRKQHVRQASGEASWPSPEGADPLEAAEQAAAVRIVLSGLPAEYSRLLTAKYIDGASMEDLAERENASPAAVSSKLARARRAFRAAYRKPGIDDTVRKET